MAYASTALLRQYLNILSTDDDELLERLLDASTAFIERYTRRRFEPVSEVHVLEESYDLGDGWLTLDDDLQSLTNLVDGAGETVPLTSVQLVPVTPPHRAILLLTGAWIYPVRVEGDWGWSNTPPGDIVHACVRLAAYWYRQRDAQVFDVTAIPDAGVITIPKGIPADVKAILDMYRRVL